MFFNLLSSIYPFLFVVDVVVAGGVAAAGSFILFLILIFNY